MQKFEIALLHFTSGTCLLKKGKNGFINEQLWSYSLEKSSNLWQLLKKQFWSNLLELLEQFVAKAYPSS